MVHIYCLSFCYDLLCKKNDTSDSFFLLSDNFLAEKVFVVLKRPAFSEMPLPQLVEDGGKQSEQTHPGAEVIKKKFQAELS